MRSIHYGIVTLYITTMVILFCLFAIVQDSKQLQTQLNKLNKANIELTKIVDKNVDDIQQCGKIMRSIVNNEKMILELIEKNGR